LYKQKQDDLYCMRSVHLDKDGWLPKVAVPIALTAKQSAFKDYITDYTELPSNIQSKANVKSDQMSAYVEYTAGNKSATEEFSEPRWRVVYDWVNDRFFLTWHYQPDFFVTTNRTFTVKSPWVHIEHVGASGLAGPAVQPTTVVPDFKSALIKGRNLDTADWG